MVLRSDPLLDFSLVPSPLAIPLSGAGALSTEPRSVGLVLVGSLLVPSLGAAPAAAPWCGSVGPGEEALAPGFPVSMLPGAVRFGGTGAVCAKAITVAPRVKQATDRSDLLLIIHPQRRCGRGFNFDHQYCPQPHLVQTPSWVCRRPIAAFYNQFVWDGVVSSSSCRKDGQTFSRQPRKMFPATSLKDFISGAYNRSLPRASPFSQSVGKWSRASVP